MNRTDAATILGIDASASAEEAKRAYQDLFTEHQVRLTNAPTPALRSLYQARLLELDEARDVFLTPSLSDADSDLPTDQPSIPTYGSGRSTAGQTSAPPSGGQQARTPEPPPYQPPRREQQPPPSQPPRREQEPPPTREAPVSAPVAPARKSSSRWIGIVVAAVVIIGALSQLPRLMGNKSDTTPTADTTAASPRVSDADSLPRIRENITVARVEFGRGDYDAANGALKEADTYYSRIAGDVKSDTAVVAIKTQLDSLHVKVQRACDALKKVAERHPGEPTCKSL